MKRSVRWRLDAAKVRVRHTTHRPRPKDSQRQAEPAIDQLHDGHPGEEGDKP
jgi:hypothetical protein